MISKLCVGVLSVTWWRWDGVGISRVGVGDEEGGVQELGNGRRRIFWPCLLRMLRYAMEMDPIIAVTLTIN